MRSLGPSVKYADAAQALRRTSGSSESTRFRIVATQDSNMSREISVRLRHILLNAQTPEFSCSGSRFSRLRNRTTACSPPFSYSTLLLKASSQAIFPTHMIAYRDQKCAMSQGRSCVEIRITCSAIVTRGESTNRMNGITAPLFTTA